MTIKIDADVKKQAQKVAKSLGLSLSSIIENKLREVVRERRIVFEENLLPNKETAELLGEIETDIYRGKNLSKPMQSIEELEAYFNSL